MIRLKERFQFLEEALLKAVSRFYGPRLVSLAVFGSVGRGTQREDSDLDFLIVARDLPRGRMKRVEEFSRVEDELDEALNTIRRSGGNTALSPIFKTPEEMEQGSPLFLDLVDDARILFDPEHVLSRYLERLRARLEALGSKRIWSGNAWYWVLKPDIKPGEVFEI